MRIAFGAISKPTGINFDQSGLNLIIIHIEVDIRLTGSFHPAEVITGDRNRLVIRSGTTDRPAAQPIPARQCRRRDNGERHKNNKWKEDNVFHA